MARSKLLPLYAQIAGRIAGEIESGRFAPGAKIYSIREICEQYNVADITAKRALQDLTQRGFIRTVTGSGAFVVDKSSESTVAEAAARPVVGFLKLGLHPAPIFVYEIDLIQQQLSRLGYPMLYMTAPDPGQAETAIERLVATGAKSLLVFPQHRGNFEDSPILTRLRKQPVPYLVVETRMNRDSYICTDVERATRELTSYLIELGHDRICLATAYPRKVEGFQAAIARYPDRKIKTWVLGESSKEAPALHRLADQILELAPTAVIASDDHAAAVIIAHFRAAGRRVPEDVSVATFGDHPMLSRHSAVPVTVVRHPCLEIAQEVSDWVQAQSVGDPTKSRMKRELTGTLIVRDSTGPAPVASAKAKG